MADMVFLTRLKPEPMGAYNASTAYGINSLVMSEDGTAAYLSVKDVPAGTPLTNAQYWKIHTDLSGMNSKLMQVIHNLTTLAEITGNPIRTELVGGIPFDEVVTQLLPVQAGSGNPYPAGGGKNLLPPRNVDGTINGITYTRNADGSIKISGTAAANSVCYLAEAVDGLVLPTGAHTVSVGGALPGTGVSIVCEYYNGSTWGGNYGNLYISSGMRTFEIVENTNFGMYIRVTSGTTVNFTIYPQIEAGSTETEYAPYENIRPIGGRTSAALVHAGKNLIGMAQMIAGANVSVEHFDHGIRVYSTTAGTYHRAQISNITLRAGVKYTISAEVTDMPGGYARVGFVDQTTNSVVGSVIFSEVGKGATTFSVTEDTTAYFGAWCSWNTSIIGDATFANIQVEIGDVATEYEPYVSSTYSANFGQTVYGGRLNWQTGELTVNWMAIDGGEKTWSIYTDGGVSTFLMGGGLDKAYGAFNVISSQHATSKNAFVSQMGDFEIKGSASSNAIFVTDSRYTDATAFKAAMSGVMIAYELATPYTIQLTPQEIAQLEGINTLYGDGSIEITGRQRTDIPLISRIEALESAILNT